MKEDNHINRIVKDYLEGNLTAQQRKSFLRMVRQNKNNADMDRVYQTIFEQIQSLSESEVSLLQELLEDEKKFQVIRLKPLMKYVAAIIVLLGVYFAYQWTRPNVELSILANTPAHTIYKKHSLPDGSEVTLYGNSTYELLAYDEHSRRVRLVGEGSFTVIPSKVPFYVITQSGYFTKVLGTKFEVSDIAEKYKVEVERGRVLIGKEDEIIGVLNKGDSLVAEGNGIRVYSEEGSPLVFDGVKLDYVLYKINEAYGAEVVLAVELDGSVKCTAVFEEHLSVTDVVDVLCEMYGYTYTIEGRRIIIQSL